MAKRKPANKSGKTAAMKAPTRSTASRVKKVVTGLASNPAVAELVAAALIAAAAALRDPKKAPAAKRKK